MTIRKRGPRKHQKRGAAKQDGDIADTQVETSTKPSRNAISSAAIAKPSHDEVLEAVASLYADELKPFGRILRKRIAERLATSSLSSELGQEDLTPNVDINYLKATCEDSEYLRVQPEEGGDWSALIIDRPEEFVDVYSSCDKYSSEMWEAVATYFQNIPEEDMKLPGGRYSCAQVLLERSLPFLEGRSLGQVCHIVQMAMSQKKILGYSNGFVVPYSKSQSALKEQCAMNSLPCTAIQQDDDPTVSSTTKSGLPMASWEQARQFLREILEKSQLGTDGEHVVPLSNVKRLFRSVYNVELSETMLGHSKLSELLQDERFGDICTVRLQAHGYTVVQVTPHGDEAKPLTQHDGETIHAEAIDYDIDADEDGSRSPRHVNRSAWHSLSSLYENDGVGNLVQRTFIHASLPPPSPLPQARPRSSSLPRNAGSYKQEWCTSLERDRIESAESTTDSDERSVGSVTYSNDQFLEPVSDEPIKIQFLEGQLTLDTDPFTLDDVNDFLGLVTGETLDFPMDMEPRQHFRFCPDEPLTLEDDNFLDQAPMQQDFSSTFTLEMPPGSPSMFVTEGCVGSISLSKVHRTFIHSPLPPPTPLRASAARRSRSLPKDAGSDKNAWEATCQALGCSSGHFNFPKLGDLNLSDCDRGYNFVDTPLSTGAPAYIPDSPAYVPPSPALTASPVSCKPYGFANRMPWTMDGQVLRLADHL